MIADLPTIIPASLRELPQWITWRRFKIASRGGHWTKIPYRGATARRASVDKPGTWASFESQVRAMEVLRDRYRAFGVRKRVHRDYGIGFVFTAEDDFVGIDLDDCLTDGKPAPWATAILKHAASYAEVSPSGVGIKIVARGILPTEKTGWRVSVDGSNLEIYHKRRFFTITGNHWPSSPADVMESQAGIDWLIEKHFESRIPSKSQEPASQTHDAEWHGTITAPASASDIEVVDKIRASRQSGKFNALWSGDTSAYGNDHSRADLALCSILAFWCGPDAVRIDQLFRQSKLMRRKWLRDDYRDSTIGQAVDGIREVYGWGPVHATSIEVVRSATSRKTHRAKRGSAASDTTDCDAIDCDEKQQADQKTSVALDHIRVTSSKTKCDSHFSSDLFTDAELLPGVRRPALEDRYPGRCRRRFSMVIFHRNNPALKKFMRLPCYRVSCEICGPVWIEDRAEWFSKIIAQWPEVYTTERITRRDARGLTRTIQRDDAYHVTVPIGDDRYVFITSLEVPDAARFDCDAHILTRVDTLRRFIRQLLSTYPGGRHKIGTTAGLRFPVELRRTREWGKDDHQPPPHAKLKDIRAQLSSRHLDPTPIRHAGGRSTFEVLITDDWSTLATDVFGDAAFDDPEFAAMRGFTLKRVGDKFVFEQKDRNGKER